jgi:hypothetical protein
LSLESLIPVFPNDICRLRSLLEANEVIIELMFGLNDFSLPVLFTFDVASSFIALLSLKSDECSYWPAKFIFVMLFKPVNLIINDLDLVMFGISYKHSSCGKKFKKFYVIKSKSDVAHSDLNFIF